MRLRIKDSRIARTASVKTEEWTKSGNCALATPTWVTTSSYAPWTAYHGMYKSMNDEVVPGFHKKRSKGHIFMNGMRSASMEISAGSGSTPEIVRLLADCSGSQAYNRKARAPLTGVPLGFHRSGFGFLILPDGSCYSPPVNISSDDINSAISQVSTAVLSARGRGSSESNLYESLAEANKLLGLLPGMARSFLNTLTPQKVNALRRAREAGSGYLAYRYGLKPLMSDIESVTKGLSNITGKTRQTSRSKVILNNTWSEEKPDEFGGMCAFLSSWAHTEQVTVRAMSLDEYYASVSSNIGLSFKNLLTVPWELVPYSFVVDWFVNVGDYIGALAPSVGYNQLGQCITVETKKVSVYTIYNPTPTSGWAFMTPPSGSCERIWIGKTRSVRPLSASLGLKSDFKLTNLTRAADAISLILQKIR